MLSAVNEAECMYNTRHAVSWNHTELVLQLYYICQISIIWNFWFVLLVSALYCWIQRCNSKQKTFSPFCDLTFAKVPHAEISFQCLFFSFRSQTCTQTQKPLCIASCFKYCDSTICCPFSAWAKDLCSVSVDYQVPSLFYLLSAIPIHLTFH